MSSGKAKVLRLNGSWQHSVVMTSSAFAKRIIDYFGPHFRKGDTFVDPCAGNNAFYRHLPKPKRRYEIRNGSDFLKSRRPCTWIISNPPWNGEDYTTISQHAFQLAEHVVWLCRWDTLLGTGRRHRDYRQAGHHLQEIIMVDWEDAGFTFLNGSPKEHEGFLLCVAHFSRQDNDGCTRLTYWTEYSGRHHLTVGP